MGPADNAPNDTALCSRWPCNTREFVAYREWGIVGCETKQRVEILVHACISFNFQLRHERLQHRCPFSRISARSKVALITVDFVIGGVDPGGLQLSYDARRDRRRKQRIGARQHIQHRNFYPPEPAGDIKRLQRPPENEQRVCVKCRRPSSSNAVQFRVRRGLAGNRAANESAIP